MSRTSQKSVSDVENIEVVDSSTHLRYIDFWWRLLLLCKGRRLLISTVPQITRG